ncbi:hypothetical protein F2Q69_00018703, partial [Brassica cretica]
EHLVETTYGPVCVAVCGDPDKPALITYPDLALNYMFCFQGLLFCPEASSLLLHNFCIYHISPLGHELGAPVISVDAPLLSADDLADQIIEVQGSGSLVTEEQPQAMVIPMEYFLMGYGLYRPTQSISPRSPLSPTRISPELFSPENMGLKLKPIKTRLSL